MAKIWLGFSKLVKCLETILYTGKVATHLLKTSNSIHFFRPVKAIPLIVIPSLCGLFETREKRNVSDTREEVVHNMALATIALKDGNVQKSEKMLQKTLDFAEDNNFPLGVVSACDMLSSLAMKIGDYEKAEDLLIRALDNLIRQGAPEDDNFVVSFNLKLSRIYSSNGNDDLAELGFKNCLHMQKNKLENSYDNETFLLWTTILYWYGKFLLSKNRLQEAKKCFLDCYKTSLKLDDLLPNQIMVILYNLGEVCQTLGENDEAFEHLMKGVSLDKKCKNPDLTYFYTKLGTVSMNKGLYKEAKLWCDEGQRYALKYKNSDAERESSECLEKINSFLAM